MAGLRRHLTRWARGLLVLPGRPETGGRFRWLAWSGRALVGVPARQRERLLRGWPRLLARMGQGLLVRLLLLGAAVVLLAVLLLRGSLPQVDGDLAVAGLSAPVRIERDQLGIPTIHAANRVDLACGLGFVHAQDRFFQMDLLRRHAAGELSELLGPAVLDIDRRSRLHRFRTLARRVVAALPSDQRAELDAYVRGVNAGYASLGVRPFEYLLLGADPQPWTGEDCLLVMESMFLMLQRRSLAVESALGVARQTLPDGLYQLLTAPGDEWDAPLEGSALATPPLPGPQTFDLRREQAAPLALPARTTRARTPPGSNSWAVAGSHSTHGGAILANDMHLPLAVPNTWYRAGLAWRDGQGGAHRAWGATLPGGPGLIIGSNGRVAWGFTNSMGDWADLVRLEIDPSEPGKYRTPAGWRSFEVFPETIHVRGRADVARPVRWTCWGPVLDDTEYHRATPFALRWAAQDAEVLNLNYLDLLGAGTLEEALTAAARSSGPQCNILVADARGDIAWTIYGRIPKRVGFDGRTPTSWADGSRRWDGYLDPAQAPRILRPPSGRLWTANNRVLAGPELARLGNGGYDRGARARQIRDRLFARDHLSEADMLALQLDDRALFLQRWRNLLLHVLDGPGTRRGTARGQMRELVAAWKGRADGEAAGYRLVADFQRRVSRAILGPLTARCRQVDPTIDVNLFCSQEGAVWRLLKEQPAHLLDPAYASWDELLQHAADDVARYSASGGRNLVQIRHPLSLGLGGVPVVGSLLNDWLALDMPAEVLDGGWADMPRVQAGAFGASQRMVVSPGREELGYFHMPCGQSGHPLSPHYRDGHAAWVQGLPTAFLPGEAVHVLTLR
jgi:penicillin amidase